MTEPATFGGLAREELPAKVLRAVEALDGDVWDVEAWGVVLSHARSLKPEEARSVFRYALQWFPTSAQVWKMFIEHEMKHREYEHVEALFQECLVLCMHTDLWQVYIQYVRMATSDREDASQELKKAYDFALEHIGSHLYATRLWRDYISFLKSQQTTNPYEESQKISMIRKVYQVAVQTPLDHVDELWKDYDSWEYGLNRDLAKEILSKLHPKHVNAKGARRERVKQYEGIVFQAFACPPKEDVDKQLRDYRQVLLWRSVLRFEMDNPQKLNDSEELEKQIDFTFRLSLLYLRHYPEMWYDYAYYYSNRGNIKEAARILQEGIKALPANMMMTFLYCDFEESHKNYKEARDAYEDLLVHNENPLVYIQYMRFSRRCEGIDAARKILIRSLKSESKSYHVYVAGAQIEQQWNKEPVVASKIYGQGMKEHSGSLQFVLHYLDFLFATQDYTNMRVVLEQALRDFSSDAGEIWDRFVSLQRQVGDLTAIESIEARRRDSAFPDKLALYDLVERFQFDDLTVCSASHLRAMTWMPGAKPVVQDGKLPGKVFFTPDTSKMKKLATGRTGREMPAAASQTPAATAAPVLGRVVLPSFKLDAALSEFLYKLPPPRGPIIDVDRVLRLIVDTKMDDLVATSKKLMEARNSESGGGRPKRGSAMHEPPRVDVFRKRQRLKQ